MSTSRSSETSNCCSRCSRRAVGIVCGFLEQRRGPGAERLPSLAAGTERCRGRLSPASLRARLDGTPVIVRTNPHDGVLRRDATYRRQQRESRPGPTDATTTSNLDTLLTSALPRLTQCHPSRPRSSQAAGSRAIAPTDTATHPVLGHGRADRPRSPGQAHHRAAGATRCHGCVAHQAAPPHPARRSIRPHSNANRCPTDPATRRARLISLEISTASDNCWRPVLLTSQLMDGALAPCWWPGFRSAPNWYGAVIMGVWPSGSGAGFAADGGRVFRVEGAVGIAHRRLAAVAPVVYRAVRRLAGGVDGQAMIGGS